MFQPSLTSTDDSDTSGESGPGGGDRNLLGFGDLSRRPCGDFNRMGDRMDGSTTNILRRSSCIRMSSLSKSVRLRIPKQHAKRFGQQATSTSISRVTRITGPGSGPFGTAKPGPGSMHISISGSMPMPPPNRRTIRWSRASSITSHVPAIGFEYCRATGWQVLVSSTADKSRLKLVH